MKAGNVTKAIYSPATEDELLEDFQQDGFAAGLRWGTLLMTELLSEN